MSVKHQNLWFWRVPQIQGYNFPESARSCPLKTKACPCSQSSLSSSVRVIIIVSTSRSSDFPFQTIAIYSQHIQILLRRTLPIKFTSVFLFPSTSVSSGKLYLCRNAASLFILKPARNRCNLCRFIFPETSPLSHFMITWSCAVICFFLIAVAWENLMRTSELKSLGVVLDNRKPSHFQRSTSLQ
jgi:hypothetical protein